MNTRDPIPVALSIAGSDSGGGAGVQADMLTFAALGVFGTCAVTALTAQNPKGVSGVLGVPADFVIKQADQIACGFDIRAAKTGMLFNADIICAVANFFESHREIQLVSDPVMIATSGARLLQDDAVDALRERLIPLASLITPNLDEAEVLAEEKFIWRRDTQSSMDDIKTSALNLACKLGVPVLLKGGHGSGDILFDVCATPKGDSEIWQHARVAGTNTHGSGCTLSAAIVARLARGDRLFDAVGNAVSYLGKAISEPIPVGDDRFIAHLRA